MCCAILSSSYSQIQNISGVNSRNVSSQTNLRSSYSNIINYFKFPQEKQFSDGQINDCFSGDTVRDKRTFLF